MRNHKIGVVHYLFCLFVCLLTVLKCICLSVCVFMGNGES